MASLSFVRAFAGLMIVGSGLITPALAQIPVIPALLPTADQVDATQPMPLDGTWLISTIRKKIRIESGRAFAVDGWQHALVFQIEPGMVVLKDLTPTGPGAYAAQDLVLIGQLTAEVQADRSLAVTVKGLLPIKYKLIPLQLDNPQWYAQEMAALGLPVGGQAQPGPPPAAYQPAPPPGYQPVPPVAYQPAPPPGYQPAPPVAYQPAPPPGYQPVPPAAYQPALPPGYQPAPPAAYQPAPPPGYQPQTQPPTQPPANPGAGSGACEAVIFNPRTGQKTCAE